MDGLHRFVRRSLPLLATLAMLLPACLVPRQGAGPRAGRVSSTANSSTALSPPAGSGRGHAPDRRAPAEKAALPGYSVEDLGTLGGSASWAYGINDAGQVVGQAQTRGGAYHGFLYQVGSRSDLGTFAEGGVSMACATNADGQVVGWSATDRGPQHAFLCSGGDLTDLGTLGGTDSEAYGVNSAGQVVGRSTTRAGAMHAFLYGAGRMRDLGTFGGAESEAYGINDAGQIVGWAQTDYGTKRAFLFSGDAMEDIGTLGGLNSWARGINNSGQVVGWASTGSMGHAFLFNGRTMKDLGTLGGGGSDAYGINASGEVVGKARTPSEKYHAFLYAQDVMADLNDRIPSGSGWVLVTAFGINDAGQIVGEGAFHGRRRAFLLQPISGSPSPVPPEEDSGLRRETDGK